MGVLLIELKQQEKLLLVHGDKRKTEENVGPVWEEMGELVTWGMQKTEVLDGFFALVFTSECSNHST